MTQDEFLKPYRGKLFVSMGILFANMALAFLIVRRLIAELSPQIRTYSGFLRHTLNSNLLAGAVGGATGGICIGLCMLVVCFPGVLLLRHNLPRCPQCRRRLRRAVWKTGECQNCTTRLFDITKS